MSIELISIVIVLGMIALMVLGLPLAWSIGAVAVVLTLAKFDPQVMVMLVSRVFDMSLNYTLMAVPLRAHGRDSPESGRGRTAFQAVHVWAGGLRGGLAIRTIIANAIMASIVGIIGAEIVTWAHCIARDACPQL
jgi:TRAP-type mannitol/chloroaromatic compound transport system permease large subunit